MGNEHDNAATADSAGIRTQKQRGQQQQQQRKAEGGGHRRETRAAAPTPRLLKPVDFTAHCGFVVPSRLPPALLGDKPISSQLWSPFQRIH